MTCKDCIHYDVCGGFIPTDLDRDVFDYCREGRTDEIPVIEERCNSFKDKSRFVELPCKVGDTVWAIRDFKGIKHPQEGIVSEMYFTKEMKLHIVVKYVARGEFGKTVFLTREAAEAALRKE